MFSLCDPSPTSVILGAERLGQGRHKVLLVNECYTLLSVSSYQCSILIMLWLVISLTRASEAWCLFHPKKWHRAFTTLYGHTAQLASALLSMQREPKGALFETTKGTKEGRNSETIRRILGHETRSSSGLAHRLPTSSRFPDVETSKRGPLVGRSSPFLINLWS